MAQICCSPPYKHSKVKTLLAVTLLTLPLNSSIALDAHQAGEQITSQIINKAVSTTEGFINTQANEFVNNFGKGRTSITIKSIESDKPSYSIDTIQPISEFNSEIKQLTFIQGSLASGENEGSRRNTLNLGLGQRYLVEDERAIAGINLFVDYEGTSKHKRASLGLEYQRSNFSLSANKYYPITDKKVIGDYTEETLPGHDINLTGLMPYAPWATIKGTHYYWDQTVGDNISGNILGVEIQLSPSTSIEFGQEDSNTTQKQSYAKLSIKLPFDDNEKVTNFVLDDQPFRAQAMMDLTALKSHKRSQQIKIEKILNNIAPVFTSSSTATVVENQTTAITLVATDEQAITYSISGTDSALFAVNGSTGVATFAAAPDYESPSDSDTNNTYAFTATATDAKGLATTQAVVVTVTDTDDTAPVFTSSATANAAENQTAAITLVATDTTTVTYSISGTDASLFSVNSGSGVVTFASAPDFETPGDSGADNVYNFTATATDTASNTTTQSVAITVTDVSEVVTMTAGGVTYSTVTIGVQTWTVNNMAHAPSNGSVNTLNTHYWDSYSGSDGSGDATDEDGYYYTWNAAMNNSTTEEAQGICASGWHIPDDNDWATLEEAAVVGASGVDWLNTTGWSRGTTEGTSLKEGGSSLFEAKLAGVRTTGGSFVDRGDYTVLWSSTATESGSSAYRRGLDASVARVDRNANSNVSGYSVRSLKN